jgi:hypothetical protein
MTHPHRPEFWLAVQVEYTLKNYRFIVGQISTTTPYFCRFVGIGGVFGTQHRTRPAPDQPILLQPTANGLLAGTYVVLLPQ